LTRRRRATSLRSSTESLRRSGTRWPTSGCSTSTGRTRRTRRTSFRQHHVYRRWFARLPDLTAVAVAGSVARARASAMIGHGIAEMAARITPLAAVGHAALDGAPARTLQLGIPWLPHR
jgi:hypothetical protein